MSPKINQKLLFLIIEAILHVAKLRLVENKWLGQM